MAVICSEVICVSVVVGTDSSLSKSLVWSCASLTGKFTEFIMTSLAAHAERIDGTNINCQMNGSLFISSL